MCFINTYTRTSQGDHPSLPPSFAPHQVLAAFDCPRYRLQFGSMCAAYFLQRWPAQEDPFGGFQRRFQVNLMDSCSADPACCAFDFCCPCASAFLMRQKVLFGDMAKYTCCQGEVGCCGCQGESAGTKLPFALPLHQLVMSVFSLSSSRVYLMRSFQIASDPMDRRLIRFNNTHKCLRACAM